MIIWILPPKNIFPRVFTKLSGCGAIGLAFSGNHKNNCSVRNALAKKFPQAKNVFIPDASGRQKRSNDDRRARNLNLAEPSIMVPMYPEEKTMLLPGLEAKMDECLAHARKVANGRLLTIHCFHVSNMYVCVFIALLLSLHRLPFSSLFMYLATFQAPYREKCGIVRWVWAHEVKMERDLLLAFCCYFPTSAILLLVHKVLKCCIANALMVYWLYDQEIVCNPHTLNAKAKGCCWIS